MLTQLPQAWPMLCIPGEVLRLAWDSRTQHCLSGLTAGGGPALQPLPPAPLGSASYKPCWAVTRAALPRTAGSHWGRPSQPPRPSSQAPHGLCWPFPCSGSMPGQASEASRAPSWPSVVCGHRPPGAAEAVPSPSSLAPLQLRPPRLTAARALLLLSPWSSAVGAPDPHAAMWEVWARVGGEWGAGDGQGWPQGSAGHRASGCLGSRAGLVWVGVQGGAGGTWRGGGREGRRHRLGGRPSHSEVSSPHSPNSPDPRG